MDYRIRAISRNLTDVHVEEINSEIMSLEELKTLRDSVKNFLYDIEVRIDAASD